MPISNVGFFLQKGNTALHIASLAGYENIVKMLVENGACVNLQAQVDLTPYALLSLLCYCLHRMNLHAAMSVLNVNGSHML